MTNIRDQCSWVHRNDRRRRPKRPPTSCAWPWRAARNLKALGTGKLPVVQSALVLGGGLAGMTTALALGDQGFAVHLCEKEAVLGGQLRKIHYTLEGSDVVGFLAELIARVQSHPKITLHLQTKPVQITGHVGNFKTRVDEAGKEQTLSHGVIVPGGGRFGTTNRAVPERQAPRRADPAPTRRETGHEGEIPASPHRGEAADVRVGG